MREPSTPTLTPPDRLFPSPARRLRRGLLRPLLATLLLCGLRCNQTVPEPAAPESSQSGPASPLISEVTSDTAPTDNSVQWNAT